MDDLIKAYKQTLREVRKSQRKCAETVERSILSSMSVDLEFSIEWMETARMPGNRRGIERRSYKQREIAKDPRWVQALVRQKQQNQKTLSDADLQKLDALLGCLNKMQYECFVLIRGNCYSYEDAAQTLGISKSLVEYYLREAEKKLQKRVAGGELLELQGAIF